MCNKISFKFEHLSKSSTNQVLRYLYAIANGTLTLKKILKSVKINISRRKTNKRLVDLREDFDSLTYDLDLCHLDAASTSSIAGSQLTISEVQGVPHNIISFIALNSDLREKSENKKMYIS